MVEYILELDAVFGSLADQTRRDILRRVARAELTVSEIAAAYDMTLAAISKHLKILEQARLIIKRRSGRRHYVQLSPTAVRGAGDFLKQYEAIWNERFDALDILLKEEKL